MADLTEADFAAACRKGEIERRTKPRAAAARYDAASGRLILDLVSGASFAFPAHLAQGLEHASAADLATVEVLGAGFGLHWEALDLDLTVEGLLAGRFGSARYMAERFGPEWDSAAAE